jgi:hypothetical protein
MKKESTPLQGMQTDGVGLSIIKQTQSTGARGSQRIVGIRKEELCVSEAKREELNKKVVLIYPNRRDLIYCMAEDSTVQEKQYVAIHLAPRKSNQNPKAQKDQRRFLVRRSQSSGRTLLNCRILNCRTLTKTAYETGVKPSCSETISCYGASPTIETQWKTCAS